MIDYSKQFASLLEAGSVPVYYEKFNSNKEIPCVSYFEVSNVQDLSSDFLVYSYITFQVRIYANRISELQTIAKKIDAELLKNGFTREYASENTNEQPLQKILRYRCCGFEKKN